MRYLTCFLTLLPGFLLLPGVTLYAQQDLQYHMEVRANLAKRSFAVQGKLSFRTDERSADSIEIIISKGDMPPVIQLSGTEATVKADTTATEIVYHFKFRRTLPSGSLLTCSYRYDRGAKPSFQYFIDSSFCMAGGYGSAWYPQVSAVSEDGSKSAIRGTGNIRVRLEKGLTAVMASSISESKAGTAGSGFDFKYIQPDIFSLYIGRYNTNHYKGQLPFYTYTLAGTAYDKTVPERAEQVLSFLGTQFGPLKIPNFSIIELPEYVSEQTGIGGASLLGGILMPSGALRRFNYALFGHELAHQWWGNLVRVKGDKGSAMLSEGLAQYGSLQAVLRFDPEHAIDYRKTGYPGYISDQSGLGYLKNSAAENDEPLVRLTGSNEHAIANSKGFLVLELLSETMGKPRFHKVLQQLSTRHQQSGLSWEDFTTSINQANAYSLDWFFRQWFERTGVPDWESSWQQRQNEVLLRVRQKGRPYKLPLELLITYADGRSSLQKIEISDTLSRLKIPVNDSVRTLKIDPYFKIIHWEEELKPAALAMGKLTRVQKLQLEQQYEAAEKLALSYLDSLRGNDPYGLESALLYVLGRIKAMQDKPSDALDYYMKAVQCASRNTDYLAYTYYRIATIAATQKNRSLFDWAVRNAVQADAGNDERDHMREKISLLLF